MNSLWNPILTKLSISLSLCVARDMDRVWIKWARRNNDVWALGGISSFQDTRTIVPELPVLLRERRHSPKAFFWVSFAGWHVIVIPSLRVCDHRPPCLQIPRPNDARKSVKDGLEYFPIPGSDSGPEVFTRSEPALVTLSAMDVHLDVANVC